MMIKPTLGKLLPMGLLAACLLAGASQTRAEGILAITEPSKDVTLSFPRPGRVAEVFVEKGQNLQANAPIAQQDDREEQAALAIDKADAEDLTAIKAQEAILSQKKVDLKRIEWAAGQGAKSQFELDSARLEVVVAEAQLKMAQFKHEQAQRKYAQTQALIAKMTLRTPIAGTVEVAYIKTGESVEQTTKVVRIINLDPLWISVPVPFAQARTLAKDAPAQVHYSDKSVATGKVVNIAGVADAGSDTLLIRVEVPNPANRQAGEHVNVSFPPSSRVAASPEKP